jgi:hypothetical protein
MADPGLLDYSIEVAAVAAEIVSPEPEESEPF